MLSTVIRLAIRTRYRRHGENQQRHHQREDHVYEREDTKENRHTESNQRTAVHVWLSVTSLMNAVRAIFINGIWT